MKCRAALFLLGVAGAACSSGGNAPPTPAASPASTASAASAASAATAPQPIAGDVEATTFAPSLGVDLTKMTRRTSGLYVQDFTRGTGTVAGSGRTAVLRYIGYLPDGKSFDSGEITITLGANKVIRAWEDGVLGMRVGGKRRLISPPHLAYGSRGAPPAIPPNAVLVFDMELLQVY